MKKHQYEEKIVHLNISGVDFSYNPSSDFIISSLKDSLKDIPDPLNLHMRILYAIIKQQAMEIQRFESKTSNADFIKSTYSNIKDEFNASLKKRVNFDETEDIREHYFDLRDKLKKSVQLINQTEKRLKFRSGAPESNVFELIE